MNNPFGLPDEVMNSIIQTVLQQQKTKYNPEKSLGNMNLKLDFTKEAKQCAQLSKLFYDAYIEAGFTDKQAFELVKGILTDKRN